MDNRSLCLLYLMGEASPEETAALSEWIVEDRKNAEAFALLAAQDAHLNIAVGKYCKPGEQPLDLLKELAVLEQSSGPAQLVDRTTQIIAQQQLEKQQRDEAKRFAKADPTRRNQRMVFVIPRAVLWVGLAAAVTIAATLLFYLTETRSTPNNTAQIPDQSQPTPEALPAFAAVVRSMDARWTTGGDQSRYLRQGAHTLSEGMVEFKLLSGTHIVIEAPTSFVLTGINTMEVLDGRAVVNVPKASSGFILDTPSARIVETGGTYSSIQPNLQHRLASAGDTGLQFIRANAVQSEQFTEFGVHVDGTRQTHVQVFLGQVQATSIVDREAAGEPVSMGESQSVVITSGATPKAVSFDETAFVREVTARLSLIDMVMGGDGTTQRQNIGLHPLTGQFTRQIKGNESLIGLTSTGRTQPVPGSQYVSAVFIPSKNGKMQGLPAGLTLPNLPETNGFGYGVMWSGREMPSVSQNNDIVIPAKLPGHNFAGAGQQAMVMHTNCGFIIDLDVIRTMNPDYEVLAVKAVVGNSSDRVEQGSPTDFRSEFYVYRDSEMAMRSTFLRSAADDQRVAYIDLSLHATDRYLTFVSTDGGDGNHQGWIVLGNAEVVLKPLPNTDLEF